MRQLRSLQGIWMAFLAAVVTMGAACWWLRTQARPPVVDAAVAQTLAAALAVVAALDVGFGICWFRKTWLPLCEGTLKRVWAGRLTSAEEGRAIVQTLSSRCVIMMAMAESPAVYALILVCLNSEVPARVVGGLLAASLAGLAALYWYGLQPATDIFRHVERIAK